MSPYFVGLGNLVIIRLQIFHGVSRVREAVIRDSLKKFIVLQ